MFSTKWHVGLLLGLVWLPRVGVAEDPLTDQERKRIADVEAVARQSDVMLEATKVFDAARAAYVAERRKFPADRKPDASRIYVQARTAHEKALQQAMVSIDPSILPLLERHARLKKLGLDKANEGENATDAATAKSEALKPIKDDPSLPRVLLIGDSISIGYTLQVRKLLNGIANVHRIPQNGGATEVGLEHLKSWLGDGRWDVIHFNFGLHDAKYSSATTQRSSREEYAKNLQQLLDEMKMTNAKLIFATTTPVPLNGVLSPTRVFDSIEERNKVAMEVMHKNGVAINDLYTAILPSQDKLGRPNDVHYQPEGYEVLATHVAQAIKNHLPIPKDK